MRHTAARTVHHHHHPRHTVVPEYGVLEMKDWELQLTLEQHLYRIWKSPPFQCLLTGYDICGLGNERWLRNISQTPRYLYKVIAPGRPLSGGGMGLFHD